MGLKKTETKPEVNVVEEPDTSAPIVEENHELGPISTDELQKAWNTYTQQLKAAGQVNAFSLFYERIFKQEGNVIRFEVDNEIQLDLFKSIKTESIHYFRAALNRPKLMLEAGLSEVGAATTNARWYTDEDKFKFLAEKYPQLNDWRTKLGLDFSY